MYEYLTEKIDESSFVIEKTAFLALERVDGFIVSDIIEEFSELDLKDISEALKFRDDKDVYDRIESEIENKTLAQFLCENQRDGILAQIKVPKYRNHKFDEEGKYLSCESGMGVSYIVWVYANTMGELVDTCIKEENKIYEREKEKARPKV